MNDTFHTIAPNDTSFGGFLKSRKGLLTIFVLLGVIGVGVGGYFYSVHLEKKRQAAISDGILTLEEKQKFIKEVSDAIARGEVIEPTEQSKKQFLEEITTTKVTFETQTSEPTDDQKKAFLQELSGNPLQ